MPFAQLQPLSVQLPYLLNAQLQPLPVHLSPLPAQLPPQPVAHLSPLHVGQLHYTIQAIAEYPVTWVELWSTQLLLTVTLRMR